MSIIVLFISTETEGFDLVHGMISYSTLPEIKRRLAHFAADLYIFSHVMTPVGHTIRNLSCLWSLIGMFDAIKTNPNSYT